jgi:hypothetical protein
VLVGGEGRPEGLPPPGQARLVIAGATAMVGGYALRCALDHAAVGDVTTIGRAASRTTS